MSKNLDETARLQSEKRQEWIREIRGERLQGIAVTSSAPRLTSSLAASFPREKRVSEDLLSTDRTGGKQILPNLPQSLR